MAGPSTRASPSLPAFGLLRCSARSWRRLERSENGEVRAILARARAELRSGSGPSLALILLLGVLGGAVMAPAAGARRQDSAYPRFVAASGAPDAFVISAPPGSGAPFPAVDLARVATFPQVDD